ncbi:MAG TPA: PEP-utilizing enzyme, partial [Nannocystis sp.]
TDTAEDVFLLTLNEVIAAADAHARGESLVGLGELIAQRRITQARDAGRTPPSIMTDEGETPPLPAPAAAPPGTLAGVGVSSGVIEGRARVIRDPGSETLAAGEILVAPFTDPGWTPLFMHASGLVMEVGGLMTHGSVVAREMGIPAVVAIEGATRTIVSGQRIRVDGDLGWVTILDNDDDGGAP